MMLFSSIFGWQRSSQDPSTAQRAIREGREWKKRPAATLRMTICAVVLIGAPTRGGSVTRGELDAVARRVMAEERIAGASVLVRRRGEVLLRAGYGFADVGLEAPAKDDTVYHVVGPMLPFTGIAVMQLVERGKLSLDD